MSSSSSPLSLYLGMHSFASLHSRPVPGTSPIDSAASVAIEPAVEFELAIEPVGESEPVFVGVLALVLTGTAAFSSTDTSSAAAAAADADAGADADAAVEFDSELEVALLIRSTRVVRSCLLASSRYVPWSTIDPLGPFSPRRDKAHGKVRGVTSQMRTLIHFISKKYN